MRPQMRLGGDISFVWLEMSAVNSILISLYHFISLLTLNDIYIIRYGSPVILIKSWNVLRVVCLIKLLKIRYANQCMGIHCLFLLNVQIKLSIFIAYTYDTSRWINNEMQCLFLITPKGCSTPGQYGNNCSKRCPDNCQEGRCNIINGTCLGCTPGWIGEYCNNSK